MGKGSTTARGYGATHKRIRKNVQAQVERDGFVCWRCKTAFPPGSPFDLGHDDEDRKQYRGPECRPCNRATNGRKPQRKTRWIL